LDLSFDRLLMMICKIIYKNKRYSSQNEFDVSVDTCVTEGMNK